jgi:hypothetical protein
METKTGNIDVTVLDASGFASLYENSVSPLAIFYARKISGPERGLILSASTDGTPCGCLVAEKIPRGGNAYIRHIETLRGQRRAGVCRCLTMDCLSRLGSAGVNSVKMSIPLGRDYSDAMESFAASAGFAEERTTITVVNYFREDSHATFTEFMSARGNRFLRRLEKRGYILKSFAESSTAETESLRGHVGVDFPAGLDPFADESAILRDFSFIAYKDAPAAYCVMTPFENERGVVRVAALAATAGSMKTGAAPAVLMRSLDASIGSGMYDKYIFTFDLDNLEMNNMNGYAFTRFPGCREYRSRILALELRGAGR